MINVRRYLVAYQRETARRETQRGSVCDAAVVAVAGDDLCAPQFSPKPGPAAGGIQAWTGETPGAGEIKKSVHLQKNPATLTSPSDAVERVTMVVWSFSRLQYFRQRPQQELPLCSCDSYSPGLSAVFRFFGCVRI